MASAVMMAMTVLSSDIQPLHFSRIFVKRDGQNILKCLNTTSSGFNFNHLFKRQSPSIFYSPQKRNSRFLFKPLASSGFEASIADPKESSITLKNAKIVFESQDENTMQVRVDLAGDGTQKVFDRVLKNLAHSAPPILGFRQQKRVSRSLKLGLQRTLVVTVGRRSLDQCRHCFALVTGVQTIVAAIFPLFC